MDFILEFLKSYIDNLNYINIAVLMAVESSFIPFPSELVVPPAGFLSAQGSLNINLVIISSTIGSLVGALINYVLAYFLGRALLYKFADSKIGHLCLLSKEKLEKSEKYFNDKGAISTFIGRLIPGIRQLISIPAGLVKMGICKFLLFTTLGAGIWNTILALIGYFLCKSGVNFEEIPSLAKKYGLYISLAIVAILLVIGIFYYFKKKAKTNNAE